MVDPRAAPRLLPFIRFERAEAPRCLRPFDSNGPKLPATSVHSIRTIRSSREPRIVHFESTLNDSLRSRESRVRFFTPHPHRFTPYPLHFHATQHRESKTNFSLARDC